MNNNPPKRNKPDSIPVWKSLNGAFLASSPVCYFRSNLYFFVDHASVTASAADLARSKWTITEQDGYHAQLVCLSRDCPDPLVIPLKFDLERGQPPLMNLVDRMSAVPCQAASSPWMHFAGGSLYIGQQDTGIWTIPIAEVDAIIAQQKERLRQEASRRAVAAATRHKALLEKYDSNGNGVLDPDEKESALADPDYIEQELDAIDANHNGRLDADELAWFDANQNKLLDTNEQTGVSIAQHLFAAKLLKEFDADGNGLLDRSEFGSLFSERFEPAGPGIPIPRGPGFGIFPDRNRDGYVDVGELETFLMDQTRRGLRRPLRPMTPAFLQGMTNSNGSLGPQQALKAAVELYWQNPGGNKNPSPNNRGALPFDSGATNRAQAYKAP